MSWWLFDIVSPSSYIISSRSFSILANLLATLVCCLIKISIFRHIERGNLCPSDAYLSYFAPSINESHCACNSSFASSHYPLHLLHHNYSLSDRSNFGLGLRQGTLQKWSQLLMAYTVGIPSILSYYWKDTDESKSVEGFSSVTKATDRKLSEILVSNRVINGFFISKFYFVTKQLVSSITKTDGLSNDNCFYQYLPPKEFTDDIFVCRKKKYLKKHFVVVPLVYRRQYFFFSYFFKNRIETP